VARSETCLFCAAFWCGRCVGRFNGWIVLKFGYDVLHLMMKRLNGLDLMNSKRNLENERDFGEANAQCVGKVHKIE